MLGNKKSEGTGDETRADRVMGRDDDVTTTDAESTQRIDVTGDKAGSAGSTGGSSSAGAMLAADRDKTRQSFAEKKTEATAAKSSDADEPTRVQPIPTKPLAGAGAGAGAGAASGTGVSSRSGSSSLDEKTQRLNLGETDADTERAAERERRRAERDQALGTRRKAAEETETTPVARPKRTTDKFFGSLGLFLLRLVTAAIMGLHGLWKVMNLDKVEQMLSNTIIPEPHIMAYVLAASEIAIALGLLFGMFTRLAGLGLALVGIGALVFVKWVTNPFKGYQLGGELELLLGAVGLLFLLVGAGGWSIDAAFRRRRAANRKTA